MTFDPCELNCGSFGKKKLGNSELLARQPTSKRHAVVSQVRDSETEEDGQGEGSLDEKI